MDDIRPAGAHGQTGKEGSMEYPKYGVLYHARLKMFAYLEQLTGPNPQTVEMFLSIWNTMLW
jgi:hypothetical protein